MMIHQVLPLAGMLPDAHSETMRQLIGKGVSAMRDTVRPILILGEDGSGKKTLARRLHYEGFGDAGAPCFELDCGNLGGRSLVSILLDRDGKSGIFNLCERGSIILQAVHTMSEHELESIYDHWVRMPTTVRLLLLARSPDERLPQNLFLNRTGGTVLRIPPLRARNEDLSAMIDAFLKEFSIRYGKPLTGVSDHVMESFLRAEWPGNVTELRRILEQACRVSERKLISDAALFRAFGGGSHGSGNYFSAMEGERISTLEREAVAELLRRCNGNKSEAAKRLGIHRTTLYRKLKYYGME